MSVQTFHDYFQDRHGVAPDGLLTDFLSRRDGRLLLGDQIDLHALVARYGAPLEVAYCPLITEQVERMQRFAELAWQRSGYTGRFVYAYATKANFAEEVVRTALEAGAHYETSATADVVIAHHLWRQGLLPHDRLMFCNGSKDAAYVGAIVALREAGYANVIPILDDLDELDRLLRTCRAPLLLGVRERHAPQHVNAEHRGGERFGLTPEQIRVAAERLRGTPHRLVVYHAMVGSQIEDLDGWMQRLTQSAAAYCQLHAIAPELRMFNFGGGMPTSAYSLGFQFDYVGFLERLTTTMAATCAAYQVPQPDLIGEFGRYTVASHSVYLMEVGAVKDGQADAEPWYLLNGSLMVSLPDTLIVHGQEFLVLPLDRWEAPATETRLAGRYTCDSDDFYPRGNRPPLMLPAFEEGEGRPFVLGFFGVGAYQQMISGRGGAHHCLTPEMRRVIIERDDDMLVVREVAPQSLSAIMGALGYDRTMLELPEHRTHLPAFRRPQPAPVRVARSRNRPSPRVGPLMLRESRGVRASA